jgi:hypothetical protein
MSTTRTFRSFLFVGLLTLALLSSTLAAVAEGPTEPSKTDPVPNPIDDLFVDTTPGEGTQTCNQAPWGTRTLANLLCLSFPSLFPLYW